MNFDHFHDGVQWREGQEHTIKPKVPNSTDRHVGSRVRMRRIMLGMSQTSLADRVGVTFQQIQKYEKGTNRIGASRLQEISNTLQAPISFFFDGAGTGDLPDDVSEFLTTSDGLALMLAFTKISNANTRNSVVALVEQLSNQSAGTAEK